jgi:hypothetical protein
MGKKLELRKRVYKDACFQGSILMKKRKKENLRSTDVPK